MPSTFNWTVAWKVFSHNSKMSVFQADPSNVELLFIDRQQFFLWTKGVIFVVVVVIFSSKWSIFQDHPICQRKAMGSKNGHEVMSIFDIGEWHFLKIGQQKHWQRWKGNWGCGSEWILNFSQKKDEWGKCNVQQKWAWGMEISNVRRW